MTRNLSITIKLTITLILAIIGILYILEKSPVSQISDYQKSDMPRLSYQPSNNGSTSTSQRDSDDVSLTGKSGQYDEVRIGK